MRVIDPHGEGAVQDSPAGVALCFASRAEHSIIIVNNGKKLRHGRVILAWRLVCHNDRLARRSLRCQQNSDSRLLALFF